ncbi:MAG: hypothetical protein A3J06_00085 [Candidatus Moranbacteria bacterium RIFCSPLOWO2_02_FULL_48_19]|nr:MAG: hypothetical protein A3J06_00085 [Candidatus Moranbacteria bacterium RIFCSPLOWO2_02_FULL_48_19]OGI30426.1 MAG: hypothetical protein A3G09_01275 [Candidatus Moranbacteria bacterium RIFCSPLOWO2_12_FULL_48_12]
MSKLDEVMLKIAARADKAVQAAVATDGKRLDAVDPEVAPGAVEASVDKPTPVVAVENRPARGKPRVGRKPATGASGAKLSRGTRKPKVVGEAPASGDAAARTDVHNGIGEASDARKQAFLAVFNQTLENLKTKISDAKKTKELQSLRRPGKGEKYRFFDLNIFADYFNNQLGKKGDDARNEAFDLFASAEINLEELYLARKLQLRAAESKQSAGRPRPRRGEEERLSIEDLQEKSKVWIEETKALIPKLDNLDALKKLTIFVGKDAGKRRSFNFPREFGSLFGKDASTEIKSTFSAELKGLMNLWQEQVVKVIFGIPNIESEFASFLQESYKTYGKKLNKSGFFRAYVEKFQSMFDGLDDMVEPKRCKALQNKLYELWDKHFAAIEVAQQAKGSGGKPEGKELTEKELFALFFQNLKEGKRQRVVGAAGGELEILSVTPDSITYNYRESGKRAGYQKTVTSMQAVWFENFLKTNFHWERSRPLIQPEAKPEGEELSETETGSRRERWMNETKIRILTCNDLAVLKAMTEFKGAGGTRRIKYPEDFRLYRKDASPDIVQLVRGMKMGLLELWKEQVVNVLFVKRIAEEYFIDQLRNACDGLAAKRITQEDFFEEYLRKFDFTDIEDVRTCAAMDKRLKGMWDVYYPALEMAVNESQFAVLVAALKQKEKGKPFGKGKDGKEFTVVEISDAEQLLRVNYDGLVRKVQPKNVGVILKYLQEQHRWSPEQELVSASQKREPEKRAGQELNMLQIIVEARKKHALELQSKGAISEKQCGYFVRHLDDLIRNAKLDMDDEEYGEVSRAIDTASKAIIIPEELIPQAQVIAEKPVAVGAGEENRRELRIVNALVKEKEKWLKRIDKAKTKEAFDAVTTEAGGNGQDVPGFISGAFVDDLLKKYPPVSDEEREKLTRIANVFQDGIRDVYVKRRNEFYPAGKERTTKERVYGELYTEAEGSGYYYTLFGAIGTGIRAMKEKAPGLVGQKDKYRQQITDALAKGLEDSFVAVGKKLAWSEGEKKTFVDKVIADGIEKFLK